MDLNKFFSPFRYLFMIFMIFHVTGLAAQDISGDLKKSLEAYASQGIQEKLYVHTDKDYYMTGEILWLKVYSADAFFHQPLPLSKVAYVEILDSSSQAMAQAKIAMDKATGTGSIYLQQHLPSGNYKLRAYTRWMQNFDAAWFFEKTITVLNLNKLPGIEPDYREQKHDVQFFPEGGNMVNGVQSKIAFKGTTQEGTGFHFTGYLLDNSDTLLQFRPTHKGMGIFSITPQSGHVYTAHIVPSHGAPFVVKLPDSFNEGVTLAITENNTNFDIQASVSRLLDGKAFCILAHSRGIVKTAAKINVVNGKAGYSINKSQLADGISVITLFNEAGQPVCERLVFKCPSKSLDIKISTHQPVYEERKEVQLSLSALEGVTANDSANVSLSVFRIDSLQGINSDDIKSYLLLSSDIKGYIEDPLYYFSNKNEETSQALDILLLTQGWRRFDWKKVLSNEQQKFSLVPELQGHIITGRVLDITNNQPVKNVTAYLSAPSSITLFKTAVSEEQGYIKADISHFFGSTTLIAQTQEKKYKVQINNPFSLNFNTTPIPKLYRPLNYPLTILDQSISMQVQNIYFSDQMNNFGIPAFADTSSFYKNPDSHYQLDKYTRFTTIEEVLREYVNLVDVRIRNKEVNLFLIDPVKKAYFPDKLLNLLDGVPVFNFTQFFDFDPLKIYSLEIIAQRYLLGTSVFNGILNWKTYKPSLSNYTFDPNVVTVDYESLQLAREFYSPVYDSPNKVSSSLPDYRNVLFWSPHITLKHGSSTTVNFYTSDLPGKYGIVVQGLSASGLMGSGVAFFEVK